MKTVFKLQFEGEPAIDLSKFQSSLPHAFLVREKNDGVYVEIESDLKEDDRCQRLIDRELDRHFFLTCVKIKANMIKKKITFIVLQISYLMKIKL